MRSKRDLAAVCSQYSGLTGLLGRLPTRPVLLVLNYHRIGNPDETPYDPGVFSATAAALEEQVRFLKAHFDLLPLAHAIEIVEGSRPLDRTAVLITFDDGYLDNYESAFPVLSAHGVQGVFFLPTSFIGTNRVSWWDTIAFLVKQSRRSLIRLTCPAIREYDIAAHGIRRITLDLLALYRNGPAEDGPRLIAALEEACDVTRPDGRQRCFMNWEEAAAMQGGGMAIGSHTHSHEILSKLPEEKQLEELTVSKQILETRLGREVHAFAYPVGLADSFTGATRAAVKRARYRVGFSYYGGLNLARTMERYNVRRIAVEPCIAPLFRLRNTLAAVSGRYVL